MTLLHRLDVALRARRRATSLLRGLLALLLTAGLAVVQSPSANADPSSLQRQEWYIGLLGLKDVWAITKGAGVTVAVLDSGVNASVGDLQGAVVPGFDATGAGGNGEQDTDTRGHGTSMAVDIAGRGTSPGILGMAPQAKVMPVVVPVNNTSETPTATALTRLTAMPHPPQVISMSYGFAEACPDSVQAAVKAAVDKGIILVASAGNEGNSTNESQFPANCAGVVAVGAFDAQAQPWSKSQRQPYVAIGGPGVAIPSYNSDLTTGTANGTSDAAAFVSGELALLRAHFPTMPARQLVARLFATASTSKYKGPGYGAARGNELGYGPALIHQALIRTVPASAANPVYDAVAKLSSGSSSAPKSAPETTSGSVPSSHPGTTVAQSFPGGTQAASKSSSGAGVLIGVVVAVIVVVLVVLLLILRQRRRQGTPPGYGPTG